MRGREKRTKGRDVGNWIGGQFLVLGLSLSILARHKSGTLRFELPNYGNNPLVCKEVLPTIVV